MQDGREDPPLDDHFSANAAEYARFRPGYPEELADYLRSLAPESSLIWEAGCGSGQLSMLLTRRFSRVVSSDASARQIAEAPRRSGLSYVVERAQASALGDGIAGLCVSAQAAHWFELNGYYSEVRRVASEGGLVVLITYGRVVAPPELESLLSMFYEEVLGPYWPPERTHVESGYQTLPFPFVELSPPAFMMRESWTLKSFIGYVSTWSAVHRLCAHGREAGFAEFAADLARRWGAGATQREFRWPLAVRVGAI